MAQTVPFEYSLKEVFVDKAPPLPSRGRKLLVQYAPWLALLSGLVSAWAAWSMWHWANLANNYINYANDVNAAFGNTTLGTSRLSFGVWLAMMVLVVQAVLLLLAFAGLRQHKKSGWNLVYYSILVSVVYGVLVAFTSYGGFSNLLWAVVGAAIGFYLIFQARSSYIQQITADSTRPSAPPSS